MPTKLSDAEAKRVVWWDEGKTYILMPETDADYEERRQAAYKARQAGAPNPFTELEVHPHAYLEPEDFGDMPRVVWVPEPGSLDGSGHFEVHDEGDDDPEKRQRELHTAYTESIRIQP